MSVGLVQPWNILFHFMGQAMALVLLMCQGRNGPVTSQKGYGISSENVAGTVSNVGVVAILSQYIPP